MNDRTLSKAEQDAEARNRAVSLKDDAGNPLGADPRQTAINDSTEELGGDPPPRQIDNDDVDNEPRGRIKPIYMSPADQKRAEFAKRFKRDDDGNVPYNGNPNDPEMQYGKFGREQEPEPEPEPQPEPQAREQPQPEKKFTIKVRGKELHLTEAELLERASKVEAADTYLDESRNLLEQARVAKRNAERTGEDPHRPEGRTSTQDDERNTTTATEDGQHPDPLEQAIEEIQFGDPKEAASKIRKVIADVSDESADQRQIQRLIQKDSLASQQAVKDFVDQNPEFKDPRTERWMRDELFIIQREEIVALGQVDADKVPTDPKAVANWHQLYRVHGAKISDPDKLLKTAQDRYETWRGVKPKPAAQQQQRKDAPRVEVNVDRNARRAAIPNQPSRPSAPVPDAVQQRPQASNRASTIMNMRKSRGQLVG